MGCTKQATISYTQAELPLGVVIQLLPMLQHGENCFISSRKSDLFAPHGDTLQQQTQIPVLRPVLPSL